MSAPEAWEMLSQEKDAVLVDVRSQPEWQFVGVPDLGSVGREPVLLSWQSWPGMAPNPDFLSMLRRAAPSPETPLLFLCRSGARSKSAAMAATAAGYARAYNVRGGFEGAHDPHRHRGAVDGWKARGLPWTQE